MGVLYDSHSHQLYLLVQPAYLADHQPLMNCEVFNVDMNGKKIVKSHEFKVDEVFLNSQWSSDPYNQKVAGWPPKNRIFRAKFRLKN